MINERNFFDQSINNDKRYAIQKINFTGNLNAWMVFILREVKETIFDSSQGTIIVSQMPFRIYKFSEFILL